MVSLAFSLCSFGKIYKGIIHIFVKYNYEATGSCRLASLALRLITRLKTDKMLLVSFRDAGRHICHLFTESG